jgi:hypothetical protein
LLLVRFTTLRRRKSKSPLVSCWSRENWAETKINAECDWLVHELFLGRLSASDDFPNLLERHTGQKIRLDLLERHIPWPPERRSRRNHDEYVGTPHGGETHCCHRTQRGITETAVPTFALAIQFVVGLNVTSGSQPNSNEQEAFAWINPPVIHLMARKLACQTGTKPLID